MRLLHTADWHLGRGDPEAGGERHRAARAARFDAARALVAAADGCAAVIVSGDLLDDRLLSDATLADVRAVLDAFAPTPVIVVPGHADPADAAGLWDRLAPGPHVRVCRDEQPVEIGEIVVLPRPVRGATAREASRDLPATEGRVRLLVAHAVVRGGPDAVEVVQRLDPAAVGRSVDAALVGGAHRHAEIGERVWNAGPPRGTAEGDVPGAWWVEISEAVTASSVPWSAEVPVEVVSTPLAKPTGGVGIVASAAEGLMGDAWALAALASWEGA